MTSITTLMYTLKIERIEVMRWDNKNNQIVHCLKSLIPMESHVLTWFTSRAHFEQFFLLIFLTVHSLTEPIKKPYSIFCFFYVHVSLV